MNIPPEAFSLVASLVVAGAVGAFGFLVKKAFADLLEGLKIVSSKLETLTSTVNAQHTEVALLRHRVERIESDMRTMREGWIK